MRVLFTFLIGSVVILGVQAVQDSCPSYNNFGPWSCAYVPKCFGDSTCPAGQQCCPHPCGNQCTIVHCKNEDCTGNTCEHGFQRDSQGCKTCICAKDMSHCTSMTCILLHGGIPVDG